MSGGRLVVLDRQGRDVKYYPLKEGLATLGSDPICDIRFMLPTVSAHHATISVHTNQCVVHAVGTDPTLVNGTVVSVAALRHGDEISVGGRRLRWEYNDPSQKRVTPVVTMPALARRSTGKRNARRRVTTGSGKPALVPPLRASMPARDWRSGDASSSSSGKQVAIVQPWGKDTNNQNDSINKSATKGKRTRSLRLDDSADLEEQPKRRWASLGGGDSATKASLWCESRRAPRRTPLKIHDPPGVDHTKQAALMLMTGHTPKPKETPRATLKPKVTPRPTPRRKRVSGTKRRPRPSQPTPRPHRAREGPHSISLLEIGPVSRRSEGSSRTERSNFLTSPILGSPKKSAMKDPTARKSTRKTESIKFDLSNLDGHERSSDLIMFDDTEKDDSVSQDDLTLHYSESSVTMSPSPKKNSRSSKILEKSLRSSNSINTLSPRHISSERSTLEATALEKTSSTLGRSPKKSLRGSIILKKALENSRAAYKASRSRVSDQSYATAGSPRASIRQTETYSVVDLVSLDSDSSRSVYGSTATFESPQSITSQSIRKTRSGKLSLLASSTPYHGQAKGSPRDVESDKETSRNKTRGRSSVSDASSTGKKSSLSIVSVRSEPNQTNISDKSKKTTRRSASLTTPENSYWSLSLNTTKATRASKSRSRINDSDLLLLDDEDDASPRSSRRRSGHTPRKNISIVTESPSSDGAKDGCVTPENEHSPKDPGTPVLNIQNLLDQSLDRSTRVRNSRKRKTIGHIRSVKRPNVARAKSFTQTRSKKMDSSNDEDGIVTPTSDVKLVPEAVKNKHSTAKKPQSKRSLIDTLDESDVVKQLFSSPVKRNLSRSMSDFTWRDDEKPVTRHTIALTGRSLNTSGLSVLDDSAHIAPEVFVSPLGTPNVSPNLSGVKRLFTRGTRNDLSDVRGVKALLKTPRARRSIGNDLTRVSGVKKTFARSPKNRLSDVRVKELFVPSPKNDLRRVSGVKSLFQSVETRQMASPNLQNIRGLFKRTPRNELVNVSGVRALKRRSPRNDLADVEGIDQLFEEPASGDVSGVELLQEQEDADSTFDRLLGKPKLKSYGKSKSMTTFSNAKQKRAAKSLHDSIDAITTNVEEWLQGQLQKSASKKNSGNASRELQKLSTATVEGVAPVLTSRSRSSTFAKDQSTLPIKKRSIASLSQNSKAELTRSRASLGRSKAEISVSRRSNEPSTRKSQGNPSKRTSKGESSLSRSKAEKSRNSKAEASLNKSKKQSNETSQSKPVETATLRLPIKKRVVVHSTPVKGVNATLNTTALARMSPIAAIDPPSKTSMATLNEPKKPAGKSKRSLQKQLPEIVVTAHSHKNSPKKAEVKNKTPTPVQPRTTRRKAAETKLPTVIKRRKSITITKKPPVLSPKPVTQVSEKPPSPKRGRSTRNKVEEKPKTPVKSRAKARRASVVVSKPSPKLKPKSATPAKRTNRTRRTKVIEEPPKETQTRQSRKTKATENVSNASKKTKIEVEKSVEKQPAKSRTRKTQIVEEIPEETEVKTARRGRKTREIKNIEEPAKRSRKTINSKVEDKSTSKNSPIKSPVKSAPKRSRRGQTNVTNVEVSKTHEQPKPRRGRKNETTTEVVEVKKGRKTRANESVVQTLATEAAPKRARTAKAEVVAEAKPVRGRKTAATQPKEESKGRRSKKITIVEGTIEIPQRGRRTKTQSTSEDKNTSKKGGKQNAESPAPKGRATRNAVKVEPSTGRSKKATNAPANKTAPASTSNRKRKSNEPVAKAETAKRRKLPAKEAEEPRSTRSRRR
ncbi:nascent polypeptide-associated complex subunit alpha, muscle-specific form-like isoform X2 [Aricia agestis]|uniref:nascent polypeptide-associated complex subunit alpha, muscle-specific form-like isoform X2 n=1 Tax=Aricia agestis TaxID=91739 RepID=UPI001C202B69|nr:nascent polypeptide-associated complex subunit alpha, muscle-specific form-like isoform X2 [Aricia agestis]